MAIITVDELQSYLRAGEQGGIAIVGSREADESFLELLCGGATLRASQHAERQFLPDPAPTTENPTPAAVERIVYAASERLISVPDVREVVSITVDADTVPLGATAYRLIARDNEPATLLNLLTRPVRTVRIVGHFGFSEPPADVKLAVLEMAARAFHNAQARLGDRVVDPDGGVTSYFRQLPPEAKGTLDSYRPPRPIPIF